MSLIKAPSIVGLKPNLTEDQQAVVEICKETLAQALEGSISSIGIVACMKTGYATVMAGRQAADLNLGADSLKSKILNAVENAGAERMAHLSRPGRA